MKTPNNVIARIILISILCLIFTLSSNGQTIKGHTLGKPDVGKEFTTTLGGIGGVMTLKVMDNNILGSIWFEANSVDNIQVDLMINGLSKKLGIKLSKIDPELGYDYSYLFENDKLHAKVNGYYDGSMQVIISLPNYIEYLMRSYLKQQKELEKLTEKDF